MSEVLQVTLGSIWVIALILSFAAICVGGIGLVALFMVLAIGGSVGALIGEAVGGTGWGVAIGVVTALILCIAWIGRPVHDPDGS